MLMRAMPNGFASTRAESSAAIPDEHNARCCHGLSRRPLRSRENWCQIAIMPAHANGCPTPAVVQLFRRNTDIV
jgi:hypothetical protein